MSEIATGVLKKDQSDVGVLRDPQNSFQAKPDEVIVPNRLIEKYDLVEGTTITGPVEQENNNKVLVDVQLICGLRPEIYESRTPFQLLVPIDPNERFNLGLGGNKSMRIIDMIAPIGKGTRGLIVSPPKAGKTILLEQIAQAIRKENPETRIIVLLIDERPEEVTQFRRHVDAEVLSSSSDQSVKEHVDLSELTLAHIRTELECGRDVVVLVDSLTRMGRAFNLKGSGSGRTLSGGIDARALEIPRRFFGLARNIEEGGSVTIIATILIDTGSRMDQIIFEEFKGTGNSEIVLNRPLAEERIFPAINLRESGTRKEERLFKPGEYEQITFLRRGLAGLEPKEAMLWMLKMVEKYRTNEELLQNILKERSRSKKNF